MLINGKNVTIGLALSGGGFRAAAYHLGLLKQLLEWDILWEIDLISSLSGGSITGAFIAQHWGDEKAFVELETFLTNQSLMDNYYFGLVNPFTTQTQVMASNLQKNLFGNTTLSDITPGPRSYISASNLATGDLFSFIAGGNTPPQLGDKTLGFQQQSAGNFKIADAVAASCAYAPVFPPYRLTQEQFNTEIGFVTLADGGLYDNLAVDPLLIPDHQIDYAIVSDAGKPFSVKTKPSKRGVSAVWRTIDVLTEKVRTLQLERLMLLHKNQQGPKPICFSIDSHQGDTSDSESRFCSSIPSELSSLATDTSLALQRHARSLINNQVRHFAPELIPK